MEFNRIYDERTYTFSDFLTSTFSYMVVGLLITAVTSLFGYQFFGHILTSFGGMMLIAIMQVGISVFFSSRLLNMEPSTARLCFLTYSFLTGVTLSYLPYVYGGGTLFVAVAMTTTVFIAMAVIGHTTHTDMTRIQPYLFAGLIALLITTVLNAFFFHSFGLDAMLNYAGIIIFLGLIAYDMQRLRQLYNSGMYEEELGKKLAIYGAFTLYLDFINVFLRVLQILAANRDND